MYESILDYNGIATQRIDASDMNFWEKVHNLDYFIYHWRHSHSDKQTAKTILPIVENHYKIACYPDQSTCWHFDDKIRQYYLLQSNNFPVTKTWIFWNKEKALKWLTTARFPLVFKLKGGAGSSNVILVPDIFAAQKLIRTMFSNKGITQEKIPDTNNLNYRRNRSFYKLRRYLAYYRGRLNHEGIHPYWQVQRNYVLFQNFLPNNSYDTRVVVIGNRAFAFRRFFRKGDFRASGSHNNDLRPSKIDDRCLSIAFQVSKTMKFQTMAYDFMINENKAPEIIEMSYTCPDTTLNKCPCYWDPELKQHENMYPPQFYMLTDLLKNVDLQYIPVSQKHSRQKVLLNNL